MPVMSAPNQEIVSFVRSENVNKVNRLPWGTQRAGFCTKLRAKNRRHEKDNIVYCFAAKIGGSDGNSIGMEGVQTT